MTRLPLTTNEKVCAALQILNAKLTSYRYHVGNGPQVAEAWNTLKIAIKRHHMARYEAARRAGDIEQMIYHLGLATSVKAGPTARRARSARPFNLRYKS